MTAEMENLVIEHLRSIRADNADIKRDLREVKLRLASIESYIATLHSDQARNSITIDDLVARVERLEKRTGLVEA